MNQKTLLALALGTFTLIGCGSDDDELAQPTPTPAPTVKKKVVDAVIFNETYEGKNTTTTDSVFYDAKGRVSSVNCYYHTDEGTLVPLYFNSYEYAADKVIVTTTSIDLDIATIVEQLTYHLNADGLATSYDYAYLNQQGEWVSEEDIHRYVYDDQQRLIHTESTNGITCDIAWDGDVYSKIVGIQPGETAQTVLTYEYTYSDTPSDAFITNEFSQLDTWLISQGVLGKIPARRESTIDVTKSQITESETTDTKVHYEATYEITDGYTTAVHGHMDLGLDEEQTISWKEIEIQ